MHLVEEVLFNFFLFFLEFERVFLLQREQTQILLWPGAIRVIHRYKSYPRYDHKLFNVIIYTAIW